MTQCLENGICGRFGSNFPKPEFSSTTDNYWDGPPPNPSRV
jgi:hypothetical protein